MPTAARTSRRPPPSERPVTRPTPDAPLSEATLVERRRRGIRIGDLAFGRYLTYSQAGTLIRVYQLDHEDIQMEMGVPLHIAVEHVPGFVPPPPGDNDGGRMLTHVNLWRLNPERWPRLGAAGEMHHWRDPIVAAAYDLDPDDEHFERKLRILFRA